MKRWKGNSVSSFVHDFHYLFTCLFAYFLHYVVVMRRKIMITNLSLNLQRQQASYIFSFCIIYNQQYIFLK